MDRERNSRNRTSAYVEQGRASDYDEQEQNGYENREAVKWKRLQKRRRARKIRKFVFGFFVILAIVAGWGVATIETQVYAILNKIDRNPKASLAAVKLDDKNLNSHEKIINILLIGSDKRYSWSEAGRSDSTMIATLDLKNKRLKLTSLMRDMYVDIPGHGQDRFNAAYSFGGVGLLYQTIAANFGIKLDGYVTVDFAAFKTVINTLGGVEIKLTDKEYKYLTTAYKKGSVLKLKPGVNNMNGTQALAYTRIRQDAEGDFGRTRRQRNVLETIFMETKSMSLTEIKNLIQEIMPFIQTDLSNEEILTYMMDVLRLGTTTIDQFRLPVDNSYTQDRIRGMAVLIPDMEFNKNELNDFVFNYDGKEVSIGY